MTKISRCYTTNYISYPWQTKDRTVTIRNSLLILSKRHGSMAKTSRLGWSYLALSWYLDDIEAVGTNSGGPQVEVTIESSGELSLSDSGADSSEKE